MEPKFVHPNLGRLKSVLKKSSRGRRFVKSFVGNDQITLDDLELNIEETECFKSNPSSDTLIWDV